MGRVLMVALAVCAVAAQDAGQRPTFRAGVRTVAIYATVSDREGRLVPDLGRDAFEVLDDGRPAELTVFSNESQPITMAVMLDMSGSMLGKFLRVRASTLSLVNGLQAGDRARIGTFGDEVAVSPLLTGDKEVLSRVLHQELWPGGGTPLWAGLDAAMTSLAGEGGRRVVLVLTDGMDTTSSTFFPRSRSPGALQKSAIDEGFMVYAIGMEGSGLESGIVDMAEQTGGGHFELKSNASLTETFARVVEELRHQYLLGFVPASLDGKTHRLQVRLKPSGLQVRARKNYRAEPER
jgi:Ca-activated chloride channel family protein